MTAHLLIMYPHPKDVKEFDRAYREEHLPYAAPRLKGATGVTTKRVVGPSFAIDAAWVNASLPLEAAVAFRVSMVGEADIRDQMIKRRPAESRQSWLSLMMPKEFHDSRTKAAVAGYAALAIDDLTHTVGWDRDLTRQLSRFDAERLKLIGEDFPWMYD
jgi:hypothetical protein